jgi:membrane peptidoglycan carboxypeptidase
MQYGLSKLFTKLLLTVILAAAPLLSFAQSSDRFLKDTTSANIAEDDLRGEDRRIRAAALKALGTAAGTIVVMNAQTGRVYSIVNQDWAITEGFKPCSTIKLVTAVGGVAEKLIRPNGNLARGSHRLDLNDALAFSNNTYFQKVGSKLGTPKMIDYSKSLGLGRITGINAPGEFAGKLPYGNRNLRIYSHADDFEVTPLQLAVMVSALTNGGKVVIPQIPKTEYSKANFKGYLRRYLNLEPTKYERVIPGMVGAVNYGTAKRIKDSRRRIAGKTGSCIFKKTWIGLFASVAPIRDPKFAVVVITRGKYARGKYSAAIAGKIYETLEPRFNEKFNTVLARKKVGNRSKSRNSTIIASAPKRAASNRKSIPAKPARIKNTVITYKRDRSKPNGAATKRNDPAKGKTRKMTVIVNGKTEIVRPRIVQQ